MMTSSKPYLIRGIYDWIVDNDLTPYVVVDAFAPDVQVPEQYIEGGRIILNISPKACRGLHLDNDRVVFSARFAGIATQVFIPPAAVLAIYAKENGRGMVFSDDDDGGGDMPPAPSTSGPTTTPRGKPSLKVVK